MTDISEVSKRYQKQQAMVSEQVISKLKLRYGSVLGQKRTSSDLGELKDLEPTKIR